ncbi:LacI family DNA-binding transcriptional regulator [Rahnella sp. C60]|uniref:LacI family DNA-binding transcriptional regulator n=1 Tax=Rahnella sp. RFA10(1/100) TaxID=2511202 RepID=UPI0010223100|nr:MULTISPECIES: LacI family DNA-binding transcriptional regulator [Rahnella]MBU9808425.1 LacI family DNA-binding transcriptional regulator [Rahnella perminowiae]MBU9815380.1 LacI family DNA-binding transcriptional regulator [Rahnella perminowiae]MCR9003601.1 LacI family DNA-binding transcriptional regulator [Rahnella perminowiae]MCX2944126.1 LacI family DNA-binding transcriptional regulator [Rahnella perminowiae]
MVNTLNKKTNIQNGLSRTATLEDVAQAAGLSPMTISRALNNPKVVRPATIARVMEAVKSTGYIPNMLAGGLATRRTKLIAVVVPQINNNMFVDTVQAISDQLAARGYHMLLCIVGYEPEDETDIVATLLSRRPDGIVLTGIHHTSELKRIILNANIPVVEIWDLTPTPIDMLIGFSHEKVGNAIGDYFLSKGFSRFGFICASDRRAMVRKNGAISVLRTLSGHDIKEVIVSRPANMEVGRHALRQLLATGEPFDAIICSSDTLAQGAIMEAEAQGLCVPDDFSVIGFADLNFAAHNRPAITTVSVEKWDLGIRAADMLADKIEGIVVEEPIVDMGYRLVIRESA